MPTDPRNGFASQHPIAPSIVRAHEAADEEPVILVVDDDARNVDVLVRLLGVKGYEPAVASSGERAIDLANRLRPNLILLDVEMPDLSGFDVCRLLKSKPETADIPIIFVTGHAEQVGLALEVGAVDFIPKPVQAAELFARVETRLRVQRLQLDLQQANEALSVANSTLEERVAERTVAIENANRELKAEIELRQMVSNRLDFLTRHDPTTRLLNRVAFDEAASEALTTECESGAFLRLELENLELLYSTRGHTTIEIVLGLAASAIRTTTGHDVIAGHIDSDGIGVLLPGLGEGPALHLADQILDRLESTIAEQLPGIGIHGRIGVATCLGPEIDFGDIRNIARAAVEQARAEGVRCGHAIGADLTTPSETALWVERIRTALINDDFVLFGQPIAPVSDPSDVSSYEALLRWRSPETGQIEGPAAFLTIAQTHNLMPEIDRWAVRAAIRLLTNGPLPATARLGVNLSGQGLNERGFADWMLSTLRQSGVDPARLIFEITEQTAVRHFDQVASLCSTLRSLGYRVALDDFGTGFASYSYLRNLRVDVLKIDRSFITDVCVDEVSAELVRSMAELGRALGMTTVAEGVETEAVMRMVAELGVDLVQGWHLGRPAPFERDEQTLQLS